MRRGYTVPEMLVVVTIIVIVSVVALPTVMTAFGHRQMEEATSIVQGALVGARDKATHGGRPSGLRLLPDPAYQTMVTDPKSPYYGFLDPTKTLAANRIIQLDPAPDYSEGLVNVLPNVPPLPNLDWPPVYAGPNLGGEVYPVYGYMTTRYPGANVLMIEESVVSADGTPNAPTSWFWNIRVGDKIQINNAGPWYTVVGPMDVRPADGNSEMFINSQANYPATDPSLPPPPPTSPLKRPLDDNGNFIYPEFLFLVTGRDDNRNGWIDEGWDGVDNNGDGNIDELAEWEGETWPTSISSGGLMNASYTIRRRPVPSINTRGVSLPIDIVIDLTTAYPGGTRERSRVPSAAFNQYTGYVDIMINPDGTMLPTTIYSSPASFDMTTGSFVHLWLAERGDLYAILPGTTAAPMLPLPADALPGATVSLKGDYRLVTLFSRTGAIVTNSNMPFLFDPGNQTKPHVGFTNTQSVTAAYNVNNPYIQAQQGNR